MFRSSQLESAGFTLIEIIVGLAVLSIIVVFATLGFRNFAQFQQYNQAVSDVSFLLNQSRVQARSAESDSSHGIKFTTNDIIQFIGDTYSTVDPLNQTTAYQLVTLEAVLTGGADELVFHKLTGLPTATGTIIVHGVSFNSSTTITISDSGVVQ